MPGAGRRQFVRKCALLNESCNGWHSQDCATKRSGTVLVVPLASGTIDAVPRHTTLLAMIPISLDTAIAITELSKRTWWRRISDGVVTKLDSVDTRTMIALSDITPLIGIEMTAEDLEYLAAADAGSAEAQDDMGQLFLAAGRPTAAMYWLKQAAQQDYPNAMQCLGRCYLFGEGVQRDENLALMWLAKAAAHGHVIALAQMHSLRQAPQ